MSIWTEESVDWTQGRGLEALQFFRRAFPRVLELCELAERVGVRLVALESGTEPPSFTAVLDQVTSQRRLPALAAEVLHDDRHRLLHFPLRQLLGEEIGVANAALVTAHGLPLDSDQLTALVDDRTIEALSGQPGFEAFGQLESYNAPGTPIQSAVQGLRVHLDAIRRTALVRYGRSSIGTGFLVGPDLLLTAGHVVGYLRDGARVDAASVNVVFDFIAGSSTLSETGSRPVPVAEFLDGSPPSAAEVRQGLTEAPAGPVHELDFALLRLGEPVGSDTTGGAAPRGWYRLSTLTYDTGNAALMLFSHLRGMVLQSTVTEGQITANAEGTRLWYQANTDKGSSGSPVIDWSGALVAMHHYSRPDTKKNQAVPIRPIAERLLAGPYAAELDAELPSQPPQDLIAILNRPADAARAVRSTREPDPFLALQIQGRPVVNRSQLRDRLRGIALNAEGTSMVITGSVDSGVSTSYDLLAHIAARSPYCPEVTAVVAKGLSAYRVDLRRYINTTRVKRRRAIMDEIYRWVEGRAPEAADAQVAKEVDRFAVWAKTAFRSVDRQWWLFIDSIDEPAEIQGHGIEELLHALLDLTEDSQLGLRVVLAGRNADKLEHDALAWSARDQANGVLREEVGRWLSDWVADRQPPVSPDKLVAELDQLFPAGQSEPDPTELQLAIRAAAARLRS